MQFLDLKKEYQSIKQEVDNAIERVLDSGVFVGGKEVENLEKDIAGLYDLEYGIGVNSGTDALFLCLKSLGIGPEDEVITTSFTFISTAEVIANLGAKPVFVDIDPKTFNINPELIEKAITEKTRAIIPVHLFGQMIDMEKIIEIAKKYNLFVIEDSAQSISVRDRKHLTGDFVCFSFFPSKNLGCYGDGGMILTNNQELADKIRLIQNHGSSKKEKYNHLYLGISSRLDEIQAAILRVKLKCLFQLKWNEKRKQNAQYYNEKLKLVGDIKLPEVSNNHVFNQYTIRIEKRDQLKEYLKEKGIETKIYYPLALYLQPVFEYLEYKQGDFPEAEKASKEVLSLPISPYLERKDQDFIIKNIKKFYDRK